MVIFQFAFDPGSGNLKDSLPGIFWVSFSFAGILGLNRSFINEVENGCIYGLMLTPVDRSAIFLGKFIGNVIFITLVETMTIPIFAIFFNISLLNILPKLIIIIFLGTIGFSAIGTLFAAISINTKMREIIFPLLVLLIVIPVLIAAVGGTGEIFKGASWADLRPWLQIIIAFDLIFIYVPILLFDKILGD